MKITGDIKEQVAHSQDSVMSGHLTIQKGSQQISINELLAQITTLISSLSPAEKLKLSCLYSLLFSPEKVDTESKSSRIKVATFMIGYYLGKFMSRTQSILNIHFFCDPKDVVEKEDESDNEG